jgi:hypothetical protein
MALQRCINSGRVRGAQGPPVEKTYATRGAWAGKEVLMDLRQREDRYDGVEQ